MTEEQKIRTVPNSELDLNLMLTDSVWGKQDVSKELKDKLMRYYSEEQSDGSKKITKESLWGLLGFYTRDMRLGNLSDMELKYCQFYIDLANDLLEEDFIKPFLIALSRAATVLELSQSKNGFLRVKQNTLRQETVHQEIEPPKRGFFGGAKKSNEGGMQ